MIVAKMNKIAQDERANNVQFEVHYNGESELIDGVKVMFAAHSEVLANLVYADQNPSNNNNPNSRNEVKCTIQINDAVSIDAFKFIKEWTHCGSAKLKFKGIIDIWFAAKKYMMTDLVQMCERKVLSLDNVDAFYSVFLEIERYNPATLTIFDAIISKVLNGHFVMMNVSQILENKKLKSLQLDSVKLLFQCVGDHELRYKAFKRYAQLITKCEAMDDHNHNHHEQPAEQADKGQWHPYFNKHFKALIDFSKMSMHFLVNTIGNDKITSYEHFVNLLRQAMNKTVPEDDMITHSGRDKYAALDIDADIFDDFDDF